MKITKTFLTFSLILIIINGYSISDYEIGDSLSVFAFNGLVLHEEPNSKSEMVLLIPYGEKIITLTEKSKLITNQNSVVEIASKTLNGKFIPELRLTGEWCKIEYKGTEGFVFDAYLSRLDPINKDENYYDYFERNYKRTETLEDFDGVYKGKEWSLKRISYESGISFYSSKFTSSGTESIVLPFSIEEAYLLFIANKINRDKPIIEFYGRNEKDLTFIHDFGLIDLKEVNGFVIMNSEWGN